MMDCGLCVKKSRKEFTCCNFTVLHIFKLHVWIGYNIPAFRITHFSTSEIKNAESSEYGLDKFQPCSEIKSCFYSKVNFSFTSPQK